MSLKRKKTDLTLAQKYEIVTWLDQKMTQKEISTKLGCSTSTISKIAAKRDEIRRQYETNPNLDRKRTGTASDVEKALSTWFNNARSRDIPVSGPLLTEKAKELKIDDCQASSGWLSRWKVRNSIQFKRQHGEQKDADVAAADQWTTTVLPELLKKYDARDIYNADETGLYYRALPDGTLATKSDKASGSKKAKDRLSVLVTCNMTGADKRKLLVIGKPRCFRGKKNIPVTYDSNSNAWMTSEIFKK